MHEASKYARHDELTRQALGLTVQLHNAHLMARWTDELIQLSQCATRDDLFIQYSRTGGWTAALLHAAVIDGDLFDALNVERHALYERVRQRLAGEQ